MTHEIRMYGSSDDLIEVEGEFDDEFTADSQGQWRGMLVAPNGEQLLVSAEYTTAGTWVLGAGPADEDVPMPAWTITLEAATENSYSSILTVSVPAGTSVISVQKSV